MSRPRPAARRLPDWPERLPEFLEARLETPFAWGSHDCAIFAADAILAITGREPMPHLRGRWTNEAEADAVLAELGGLEEATAAAMALFGSPDCPPTYASRGDLVFLRVGNEEPLGIVEGDHAVAAGPDGLVRVPLRCIRRAWAV